MQNPKKIHLVTRSYLEGWAAQGVLRPVSVRYGRQKLKAPAGVGWRQEWWGRDDPLANRVCEESCGKLETVLPEALANIETRWPLAVEDRSVLAQFMALHVLRTEAFAAWFGPTRDASIARFREHFPTQRAYERFRSTMQSDRERSKKLLSLINKLSSVFASMHSTLLRFDDPLLITGDQPVCPVPILTPGAVGELAPTPSGGWLETCEIRCPLTPRLALVASWYMGSPAAPVSGTWAQAVNLNTSVVAQTVDQYFQMPEREPAMAPAIFLQPRNLLGPISAEILPEYSMDAAATSPLRQQTQAALTALIEDQDHETITVVSSQDGARHGQGGASTTLAIGG